MHERWALSIFIMARVLAANGSSNKTNLRVHRSSDSDANGPTLGDDGGGIAKVKAVANGDVLLMGLKSVNVLGN